MPMRLKSTKMWVAALFVSAWLPNGSFAQTPGDDDTTIVADCSQLPPNSSIEVFSNADAGAICWKVIRVLEGVSVAHLHMFEKAAYILSRKGYEVGDYQKITDDLVDVIRLRGLYRHPDFWKANLDLIVKTYVAFNGLVSPADIRLFLASAGPEAAKALSDDGLLHAIILMKETRQSGG